MDEDPNYVSGSDSDLDTNRVETDESEHETENDSVFHHVNTNFVTRSGRKVLKKIAMCPKFLPHSLAPPTCLLSS